MKPWKDSNDEERLDPYNGLPLTATYDALFDRGLISFEDDSSILISPALQQSERALLLVFDAPALKHPLEPKQRFYLATQTFVKPTRGSSRSPKCGARHRDDEFK
jgi:putative restriction endonuclease